MGHPLRRLRADRLQGHAAPVHALEHAESGETLLLLSAVTVASCWQRLSAYEDACGATHLRLGAEVVEIAVLGALALTVAKSIARRRKGYAGALIRRTLAGMKRRGFLCLLGAAVPGLWLGGRGLIALPREMMLAISGTCAFCKKPAESVFGLAGKLGRPVRICNECVRLCLDIMSEEIGPLEDGWLEARAPADVSGPDGSEMSPELERAIAELKDSRSDLMRELLDEQERWRQEAARRPVESPQDLWCSFCDTHRSSVAKLIAGPEHYICDGCAGEAAGILAAHSGLRA